MIVFAGILIILIIIFTLSSKNSNNTVSKNEEEIKSFNLTNKNNSTTKNIEHSRGSKILYVRFNTLSDIKLGDFLVKKDQVIKLPKITLVNKEFLGWSYLENGKMIGPFLDELLITNNIELVASWKNKFTITNQSGKIFLETKLTGVTFNNRQSNIKRLRINQELIYDREANNLYDSYAILVKNIYGDEIGYIPKDINRQRALKIDNGSFFNINVKELKGFEGSNLGVTVFIKEL